MREDRVRANSTRVTCVCTLVGSNAARIDSLHGQFCCTSNLHLPHNITFTFHSSGYLQTVVQRVKKLFLKIFVLSDVLKFSV